MIKYINPVLILACLLVLIAPAQAFSAPSSMARADLISPDELEAFLDAFFAEQLPQTHTPGAVIAAVQNGEILLSQGYGLADVEQSIPMDAGQTVLPIGSISKLFVATAVMQLVEQGRLDLHTDVNRYLTAFKLDATFEPVTLAHLLTHTSGLDEA